mgnify:CR=1 FL=1
MAESITTSELTADPAGSGAAPCAPAGSIDQPVQFLVPPPGTPEQLATVAKDFKVYYKKVEGKTPTSYSMDHSAGSFVYDTQGRIRLYTRYGTGAQALADDIRLLLKAA